MLSVNKTRTTPIGEFTAQIDPVLENNIEAYLGIPYAKAAPFALPEILDSYSEKPANTGGITPYQLPWLLTRLIALRDFGMMALGKLGGEKVIIKAFSSTEYSEEDLKYVASIFRHCTYKTLWNTFDSCNNYQMPKGTIRFPGRIHYWYAEKERKARDWDLKYMKKFVPDTVFKSFEGMDHGDMALFYPERMAQELCSLEP